MSNDRNGQEEFLRPIRRNLIGFAEFFLMRLFLLWRSVSPWVERFVLGLFWAPVSL